MIEKKDFLEAYNSFSGYKKLSEMIANDFFEHQDFEVAKKQHFWLKQRFPNDFGDFFIRNLLKLNYHEEALFELNKILNNTYIKTGQLSKEIKQSPQLLAKVALFLKHEKQISEKLGSPTYGEGVADVVKQFTSDAKDTSRISAAMQSAGAGQGKGKVRDWSSTLSGDSEEVKKKESF